MPPGCVLANKQTHDFIHASGIARKHELLPAFEKRAGGADASNQGAADVKWKIRLARDMAQEAYVVIEALTAEQAEAIFWNDVDPDVIEWSNDDVMGDREVIEICPADAQDDLTPLKLPPARIPEA
jgi:hypothetical protein